MKKLGRYLFLLHGWSGLVGGILLFLVALSGSLLAFTEELDHLLYPHLLKVEPRGTPIGVDSMLTAVHEAYPEGRGLRIRRIPREPSTSYEFSLNLPSGAGRFDVWKMAYVDPYTGKVLGARIGRESLREHAMGWMLSFHYSLQAKKAGRLIVGLLSILFAVSLISGALFYRRHLLGLLAFRKPLPFRDWRTAFSSLHRVLGAWGLAFNLLMAVSGFWMMRYVFDPAYYAEDSWQPQPFSPSPIPVDTILGRIRSSHPDFIPQYVSLPDAEDPGYSLGGEFRDQGILYPPWSSTIALDGDGRVTEVQRIDQQPWGERVNQLAYSLHAGQFGGVLLKGLYFLGGLSAPLLSATGFAMALRRRRHRAEPPKGRGSVAKGLNRAPAARPPLAPSP